MKQEPVSTDRYICHEKHCKESSKGSSEMRKSSIRTGILSLMLIFLSACADFENGGTMGKDSDLQLPEGQPLSANAETMPEETVSDINQGTMPEETVSDISQETMMESNKTEPVTDQTAEAEEKPPEENSLIDAEPVYSEEGNGAETENSLAAYRKTVEESGEGMVFSLINLDGDELPELVAGDRGNDEYSIYMIKDGTVFCLVDSMTTTELTYFEGSGIIAAFARWNGGGDEGGYGRQFYQTGADQTLTDEALPLLSYSYNAVYNEEGIYTGKGVTEYFYGEQEIDESSYDEMWKKLGITEDSSKLCLENAVFAEEMLDILR